MASTKVTYPLHGGCACGSTRYALLAPPLAVNVCHCTECQVQTGSAFAINGQIEHFNLEHISAEPELSALPAANGPGQPIVARCAICKTMIWSVYPGAGNSVRVFKIGTLDKDVTGEEPWEGQFEPTAHIHVKTKVPWVKLPDDALKFEGLYDSQKYWSKDSLERLERLKTVPK